MMQGELECEGLIRFGSLPWEISERLTGMSGNWLRYSPEHNALVVNHELPVGCPAMTGVCCELISFIDTVPVECRSRMPGGTLHVRDTKGPLLRLVVAKGEVRIQWPEWDFGNPEELTLENFLREAGSAESRVRGWARFVGRPSAHADIRKLVDRVGGVFPEEDLPSECEQHLAYVEFKDSVDSPRALLASLEEMAEPGSLDSQLDFRHYSPSRGDREFRIVIEGGAPRLLRPTTWKQR
jgi:hypothetical protein